MKKILLVLVVSVLIAGPAYADYLIKATDTSAYSFSKGKPGMAEAKGNYTYIVNEAKNTLTETTTNMNYGSGEIDLAKYNPATWNITYDNNGSIVAQGTRSDLQDFIVFHKNGTYKFFQNIYYDGEQITSIWFGSWERIELSE